MTLFLGIFALLVVTHLLGAAFHHTRNSRRGHNVNIGWSLWRGWWGKVHVLGGNYYHDL